MPAPSIESHGRYRRLSGRIRIVIRGLGRSTHLRTLAHGVATSYFGPGIPNEVYTVRIKGRIGRQSQDSSVL